MTGQTRAAAGMDFSGNIGQRVSPVSHYTVTTRFSHISRTSNGMDLALKAVALASALNPWAGDMAQPGFTWDAVSEAL